MGRWDERRGVTEDRAEGAEAWCLIAAVVCTAIAIAMCVGGTIAMAVTDGTELSWSMGYVALGFIASALAAYFIGTRVVGKRQRERRWRRGSGEGA